MQLGIVGILLVVAMGTAELPKPQATPARQVTPPYPPSGWRPLGEPFSLPKSAPQANFNPPKATYGPPPNPTYGPPKQTTYEPPPTPAPSYGPPPPPSTYVPPEEVTTEAVGVGGDEPPEVNAKLQDKIPEGAAPPPQGSFLVVVPQSKNVQFNAAKSGKLVVLPVAATAPLVAVPIRSRSTTAFSSPYASSFVQVIET